MRRHQKLWKSDEVEDERGALIVSVHNPVPRKRHGCVTKYKAAQGLRAADHTFRTLICSFSLGDRKFVFFFVSELFFYLISWEEVVVEASVPLYTVAEEAHEEKTHPETALPSEVCSWCVCWSLACLRWCVCPLRGDLRFI